MSGLYDDLTEESKDGDQLRNELCERLDQTELNNFAYLWEFIARDEQLPPPGDWRVWMIMAGRGFGKTRAGAEWVRMIADRNPDARIALVSSSIAEARAVMVEGESGLLAICKPGDGPVFEPSLHRLRFASGAQAQLFSASEPESLRGPQHSHACGAGAEGILRQSGAEPARCLAAAHGEGLTGCTPVNCSGWCVLPDQGTGLGCMGAARGSHRALARRRLALRRAGERHGTVRSGGRPHAGLPIGVASGPETRAAIGWNRGRRRGSQRVSCLDTGTFCHRIIDDSRCLGRTPREIRAFDAKLYGCGAQIATFLQHPPPFDGLPLSW